MSEWFATVLNLPFWLVDMEGESTSPTKLRIRQIGGVRQVRLLDRERGLTETVVTGVANHVLTPDGEEVVLVARKSGWMRNLEYKDVEQLGRYRAAGGPKYDPELSMNLRKGEPVVIMPLSMLDTGETPEQPWGEDWKKLLAAKASENSAESRHVATNIDDGFADD